MSALSYLLNAYRLKDRQRSGWALRGVDDPESVADHAWGTALLCLLFADEAGVDRAEALEIAVTHDLAEAEIGDLPSLADPALRPVGEREKAELEARAMAALHQAWPCVATDRIVRRWQAYEDRDGPAARFVRDMNLLDMALQALIYEREGRYDPRAGAPDADPASGEPRTHLDEFLVSAEARMATPFGRARLAEVAEAYREARAPSTKP